LHDREEAEEVLQTVYLKVLDGRAKYGGQSSFQTWLFAVIRKTAIDSFRRRIFRRRIRGRLVEVRTGTSAGESLEEELGRSETRRRVRQSLAALPNRQREVLQLVFYHGLSLREAAEVMSVSIGSARKHYDRGKKRIRQSMEETENSNEH
jgi:RNA polymerase sigma-70 factor (ECF subfamily)